VFAEKGATRLLNRVDNDVDFYDALETWQEALLSALQDTVAA
jgi:sulfite reductase alpha subunit-like flavoprotein